MPAIVFWRKITPGTLGLADVIVRLNAAWDKLSRALVAAVPIEGAKDWDPPSVAAGTAVSTDVDVPGAQVGMFALAAFSQVIPGDARLVAQPVSSGVVRVFLQNNGAGAFDLAAGRLRVNVWE